MEIPKRLDPPLLLRPMEMADLEQVMAIEQAVQSHPWSTQHFQSSVRSGHRCELLCQTDPVARVCVTAFCISCLRAGDAELLNIAVHPRFQRGGLARYLLLHLCQQLISCAETLFLEVRASNEPAMELYGKLGFNEVGQRLNYYPTHSGREHAIIMAKTL